MSARLRGPMRYLIDICHPAHVHFFRHPVEILRDRGHDVLLTSRDKEVTVSLLQRLGWEHRQLSTAAGGSLGLASELAHRNRALLRVVREYRPTCLAAIGGIFVSQVGAFAGVPSIVFYDTENARLQNLLTYPFASLVVAPRCYEAWLPRRSVRYDGYHELSYLHPSKFTPDRTIAIANGLDPNCDTFLVRLVAWKANHDIGENGWTIALLESMLERLSSLGKVLVSSERALPERLEHFRYMGDPNCIHHLMAFCRLHIGESATMASESAILGVPAIYAAHTGRGYTNEQESRYALVKNLRRFEPKTLLQAIDDILAVPQTSWLERKATLLDDTIDVAAYAAELIESRGSP